MKANRSILAASASAAVLAAMAACGGGVDSIHEGPVYDAAARLSQQYARLFATATQRPVTEAEVNQAGVAAEARTIRADLDFESCLASDRHRLPSAPFTAHAGHFRVRSVSAGVAEVRTLIVVERPEEPQAFADHRLRIELRDGRWYIVAAEPETDPNTGWKLTDLPYHPVTGPGDVPTAKGPSDPVCAR